MVIALKRHKAWPHVSNRYCDPGDTVEICCATTPISTLLLEGFLQSDLSLRKDIYQDHLATYVFRHEEALS